MITLFFMAKKSWLEGESHKWQTASPKWP